MKKPILRPRLYSGQELEQLFGCPGLNPKSRTLLMDTYAASLRVSKVCHLRTPDLLSDRYQIRLVQGKGKKSCKGGSYARELRTRAAPRDQLCIIARHQGKRRSALVGRNRIRLARGGSSFAVACFFTASILVRLAPLNFKKRNML